MKTLLSTIAAVIFSICLHAQVNSSYTYVNGYYKSNGTYVDGYYKTTPNYTNRDNYSTYPNVNPWTGSYGTVQPDNNYSYSNSSYSNSNSYYTYPTYQYSNGNSYGSYYNSYYH